MVGHHEINSLHKLDVIDGLKLKLKLLLFEIRTNFILKTRRPSPKEEEGDVGDDEYRLHEYWMPQKEIDSLVKGAVAFANRMAAEPENAPLDIIPTVLHLEVRTVQREGESFDAAMDRAIRAQYLVPLYVWPQPTSVERKLSPVIRTFLRRLERVRVEDVDVGLGLMQACRICSRKPNIGDQVSSLPCGGRGAFLHSHCIVRWWEDNDVCPSCPCTLAHHVSMSPIGLVWTHTA
ncbi:hypothetical protein PHJA_002499500 [Phtheirospermum japonicum]|uniref:RING-type domain-containing protein n=1 Tax=Phtheirospermum japonicum TaxID=374723 RepID=A0A830CWG5_9LAMI|nr:hypothetical protein PHJA_002499500 [Phtheirospermum japonicum]